jgi:hypothetical protein
MNTQITKVVAIAAVVIMGAVCLTHSALQRLFHT